MIQNIHNKKIKETKESINQSKKNLNDKLFFKVMIGLDFFLDSSQIISEILQYKYTNTHPLLILPNHLSETLKSRNEPEYIE